MAEDKMELVLEAYKAKLAEVGQEVAVGLAAKLAAAGEEVAGGLTAAADGARVGVDGSMPICPPIAPLLETIAFIVSNASRALKNNLAFQLLSARTEALKQPLEEISKSDALQAACGAVLQGLQMVLQDAQRMVERYSEQGWLQKWFSAMTFKKDLEDIEKQMNLALSSLNLAVVAEHSRKFKDLEDLQRQLAASLHSDDGKETGGEYIQAILQEERANRAAAKSPSMAPKLTVAAAKAGNFIEVERLLREDKDTCANDCGGSYFLLHQAVFWESTYAVMMLINLGADVNIGTLMSEGSLQMPRNSTPLHLAVTFANEELVRMLLCAGADPGAKDANDQTPSELETTRSCRKALEDFKSPRLASLRDELRSAVQKADWRRVEGILVQNGMPANVMVGGDFGLLHYAAYQKNDKAYKMLLKYRASPLLRSAKGKLLCSEIASKGGADGKKMSDIAICHEQLSVELETGWTPYSDEVQLAVAKAFVSKEGKVTFNRGGTVMELDLVRMVQVNTKTKMERRIRRHG